MKVECYIDVAKHSKMDVLKIWTLLKEIVDGDDDSLQLFTFADEIYWEKVNPTSNYITEAEPNPVKCFQELHFSKKTKNTNSTTLIIFMTDHPFENGFHGSKFEHLPWIEWIIIGNSQLGLELFADSINATNIYLDENTPILLDHRLQNINWIDDNYFCKKDKDNKDDFFLHGTVEYCAKSLLNPFLLKVVDDEQIDYHFYYTQNDNKINFHKKNIVKYKSMHNNDNDNHLFLPMMKIVVLTNSDETNKSTKQHILMSYQSSSNVCMQIIATSSLRNYITQNQNDLFALQCVFLVNYFVSKNNSNESLKMQSLANNCILPIMRRNGLEDIILNLKSGFWHTTVRSIVHLFAILFAMQLSENDYEQSLVKSIDQKQFMIFVLLETLKKQFFYNEIKDICKENFQDLIYYNLIEPDLRSSISFATRLHQTSDSFFIDDLIDFKKCKKMLYAQNLTSLSFVYTLKMLESYNQKIINLNELFETKEHERDLMVLTLTKSKFKFFKSVAIQLRKSVESLFLFQKEKSRHDFMQSEISRLKNLFVINNHKNHSVNGFFIDLFSIALIYGKDSDYYKQNFQKIEVILKELHLNRYFKLIYFDELKSYNVCFDCFESFNTQKEASAHYDHCLPYPLHILIDFKIYSVQHFHHDFNLFQQKMFLWIKDNGLQSDHFLEERFWQLSAIFQDKLLPEKYKHLQETKNILDFIRQIQKKM